jgi:glycosyltransferase involved in cell wall biosynthesis
MTVRASTCHVLIGQPGPAVPAARPGEIRAFAKCRNELLRLPAFLRHYRALGVDRFVIVDNDSTDGTAEYLAREPDVHVLRTSNSFREARGGTAWLNAMLREYGTGSWCVTVAIDELLVYPGSEEASLRALTAYFDRRGYQALGCLVLDLYPAGALKDCRYESGGDLIAAAPYFDPGPYHSSKVDLCPGSLIRGGVRERVFYPEFKTRSVWTKVYAGLSHHLSRRIPALREVPWIRASRRLYPPSLTAVPLVLWDRGSEYPYGTHFVTARTAAPEWGAILHFKFLQDFHGRAVHEAARGEYYDGASEYRRYAERFIANPHVSLTHEGSLRYEGTPQLVRLGLMRDTDAWATARAGMSPQRVIGTT